MRKKEYRNRQIGSSKILAGIMLTISIILSGLCICIVWMRMDNEKPVIWAENEVLFLSRTEAQNVEEKNYDCLLDGIASSDNKDGDLTKKVLVYSVKICGDNAYAIVNYKVLDSAGNVGDYRRLAYLKSPSEIQEQLLDAVKNLVPEE